MTKEPYRPEFVEVDIPVRVTVEGTCAWCGAYIRYRSDEDSTRCTACGAQSAKALAPKRRERKRLFAKKPRVEQPAPIVAVPPAVRAGVPIAPQVERVVPEPVYWGSDLGPAAVPLIGLVIGAALGGVAYFPIAHLVGTAQAIGVLAGLALLFAVGLTLRKRE